MGQNPDCYRNKMFHSPDCCHLYSLHRQGSEMTGTYLSHISKTCVRNNSKRVQHQLTSHHHCWVLVLALSASRRSGKITWSLQQSAAGLWPLQHLLNASMSFAPGFLQNFYSQCICIWKNTWFWPERNKQNIRNLLQVWLPLWETKTKRKSYFHLLPINH